jgi:hypothetical protein
VCTDLDGRWVAGIYNVADEAEYALGSLGIRDADDDVRQTRVTSALIVRSLERAVELGHDTASIGRSLPFLGKGPIWFKAKWGGIITLGRAPSFMYMFIDVRHRAVRRFLATRPIIHIVEDEPVASTWLDPGDEALRTVVRESRRYPGIGRWYVLGLPETLELAGDGLAATDLVVPVPVDMSDDRPLWIGEALRR